MKDVLAFLSAALVMMLIIHCNVVREQGQQATAHAVARNYFPDEMHSDAAIRQRRASHRFAANDGRELTATLEATKPLDRAETTHAFQDARVVVRNENSKTIEISNFPGLQSTIEHPRPAPAGIRDAESQCDLLAWIGPLGTESAP